MECRRCQHFSRRTGEIFLVTALVPLLSRQLICTLAALHRCVHPGVRWRAEEQEGERRERGQEKTPVAKRKWTDGKSHFHHFWNGQNGTTKSNI